MHDTWPPRCCDCGKFIAWERSNIVQRYDGNAASPGLEEYQEGVCVDCERQAQADAGAFNGPMG